MIGTEITTALLHREYEVVLLTREKKQTLPNVSYAIWDVNKGYIDEKAIMNTDYIIHLAGANVAEKRWTEKRKQEIVDSRVKSAALLVKALKEIPNKVTTVISASAIGWYGPDPVIPNPAPFQETAPAGTDFLSATCRQWEQAIKSVIDLNKRLVILRTGIVLSGKGGAFKEFEKPLQFGMAAILGNGKQVVSWIHIQDLVQMYIRAMEQNSMSGVYNAVAPEPVSNKDLILSIANQRAGFFINSKVPGIILKIMLGEMSIEVLKSCTVSAKKIEDEGFQYSYPDIQSAVKQLSVH